MKSLSRFVGAPAFLLVAGLAAGLQASEYDVAAYVCPTYQSDPRWSELNMFDKGIGEWQSVLESAPKWLGHCQPLLPLRGFESDADPQAVARKIDSAADAGVNVFIYDWYWYDGRPFLEDALDKGFLGAPNNGRMRFFVMWANHDVDLLVGGRAACTNRPPPSWRGEVSPEEFRAIARRWVDKYFTRPNYYRIDGKPVLMIYEIGTFLRGMGGLEKAAEGIEGLRAACREAGLGGLHLMARDCRHGVSKEILRALGVDSATMCQFAGWAELKDHADYASWADRAMARFDAARDELGVGDYFPHVSAGWDENARFPAEPARPAVTNSTPEAFEAVLRRAKEWCEANARPGAPKLITVGSWNEWTEGSSIEPGRRFGAGYLDAVRNLFGKTASRPLVVGISDMCHKDHNTVEEYYANALRRCGHIPFLIPKTDSEEELARILERVDAVLISGGGPTIRLETCCAALRDASYGADSLRDRYDSAIMRYAISRRIPVLGICRGEQLMNVFFGGTLYTNVKKTFCGQDGKSVVSHGKYSYFGAATNPPTHSISIVPGTKLARLLGTNDLNIASHHNCAVNRLGPGLRICAYAPDGVVEAIESIDYPMIGVQFHPETVVSERPRSGFELPRLEALFRRLGDYGLELWPQEE